MLIFNIIHIHNYTHTKLAYDREFNRNFKKRTGSEQTRILNHNLVDF